MRIDRGVSLEIELDPFAFHYAPGVFGPAVEIRYLDAIRASLLDPTCSGPDALYAIAMDVGLEQDGAALRERQLVFGVVAYAAGRLGQEPVRSQGHVHKLSVNSGWAPPEIFEIWSGRAIIYLQQSDGDDPGRCIAIEAEPGDHVVVPPGWAHAAISADPEAPLVFGAWCDRDFGFVYDGVRRHGGLAWFPLLKPTGELEWFRNVRYRERALERRRARSYHELGLCTELPLYGHFTDRPESIAWVSDPARLHDMWPEFEP
jgi:glucose-6-phosphate isomerase, archaeal